MAGGAESDASWSQRRGAGRIALFICHLVRRHQAESARSHALGTVRDVVPAARLQTVVRVDCNESHPFAGPPASLRVTHAAGVVVGYSFRCEQCSAIVSVDASPEHIAMLFEMGVQATKAPTVSPPTFISEKRRLVSWRYLHGDAGLIEFVTESDPHATIEPPAQ